MSTTSSSYGNVLPYTVLLGMLCYLAMGIFPMTLFETDATGVLAGCKRILETGRFGENEYTCYFHSQPGIYGRLTLLPMLHGIWLLTRAKRWQLLWVCLLPVYLFITLIGGGWQRVNTCLITRRSLPHPC